LTAGDYQGHAVAFNQAISHIAVLDGQNQAILAAISIPAAGDTQYISFPAQSLLIYPEQTRRLHVQITIASVTSIATLRIGISEAAHLESRFLDGTTMLVRSASTDTFPMFSDDVAIRSRVLAESFINYPNPFIAGCQSTDLEYFLEAEAEVSLKIYNIVGQLVKVIVPAQIQPVSNSLFRYTWDGRNGSGQIVLNGIYFAVLQIKPVQGGESKQLVLKIAVLK